MPSVRERVPRDLALVGLCTLFADVVVSAPVPLLRVPFGVLLALVLPGYAVVSALFPELGRPDAGADAPSYAEEAAFAVGASVVVTSVVALAFNFSPFGIELGPVLFGLNVVTFAALGIAARRRSDEQSNGRARDLLSDAYARLSGGSDSRRWTATNAVLALSVLLVVTSAAYAVTASNQAEPYTEFYLLTENESGELVADDFPTEFVRGESKPLHLGIDNREGTKGDYTVVVMVQRVRTEDGSVTVLQEEQVKQLSVTVGPGESRVTKHRVAPTMVGQNLRLTYLLYKGDPPADPSAENAYRKLHLVVDVSESEGN